MQTTPFNFEKGDIDHLACIMLHEGTIDYTPSVNGVRALYASFCGMTGFFENGRLKQLACHNLVIDITENGIRLTRGDVETFRIWVSRIATFGPARLTKKAAEPLSLKEAA